jgi:hypothetical protein
MSRRSATTTEGVPQSPRICVSGRLHIWMAGILRSSWKVLWEEDIISNQILKKAPSRRGPTQEGACLERTTRAIGVTEPAVVEDAPELLWVC